MKTSLDIPEDLMREVRILAAMKGQRIKEVVAESLRATLASAKTERRPSIRGIEPVSVGRVVDWKPSEDLLEEMLDERGHRC